LIVVALGLAGSLGAVARFVLDSIVRTRLDYDFPFGTLLINVSGSALLGLLAGLVLFHGAPSDLERIAGTGFCGGYTTFSTASFETVRLAQRGDVRAAVASFAGTLIACLAAAGALIAVSSL
jgi:CrcB protein